MTNQSPTIFLAAAEVSGDAHAAGLIQALRQRVPQARFIGVGGDRMAAAGCELIARPVDRATMLLGALGELRYFHRLIGTVGKALDEHRPDVLVPVDSPALNWHLAAAARKRKIPVMYYIAPQVWAWAPWRVKKLRRLTDAVACILPFEEPYLRERGVNARFVGHPLWDRLDAPALPDLSAAARDGSFRVALLPGSRQGEIARHAAPLATVMDALRERFPRATFTFTAVDAAGADLIRRHTQRTDLPILTGQTERVLSESHFAITTSGTVTLEAAHFGVPMVIFYRVGRLGYNLLGRWVIRTPYLSLVNILAKRELVPELMPWWGDVGQLTQAAIDMLSDPDRLVRTRADLLSLVAPLKAPAPATAAGNAAEMVLELVR